MHNTAWLFAEKGVAMLFTLSVNIILARYLAPEQFGQFNYLLSFMAILAPFSALGLNALIIRELVNRPARSGTILATALSLRVIGGLAAILLVAFACLFVPFKAVLADHWLILAAIASSFSAAYLFDFYFQAQVASRYVVRMRLSVLITSSIVKLVAVCYGAQLPLFLTIILLEPIATALLLFLTYKVYSQGQEPWQFDKQYGFELLTQSRWLILSGFMSVVYLKIDQLMLGQMLGAAEVGRYAVAARLSEVWYFFPAALVASFFPKLLRSRQSGGEYARQLQRLCDLLFCSALLLAVVVTLLAKPVVILFFGEQYSSSALILQIHIWAGVFIFMRALLSKWLIAEDLLPFSLLTHGVAALLNVLLNFLWIPTFAGQGAAWATLLSYACSSYVVLWFNAQSRPMAVIMSKAMLAPLRVLCLLKLK